MKNQLEWASVDNLDEARKIARLASLAVPELQPDFEKKPLVEISAAAAVADYRFVRITDKTDKALYGFFPTDFGCFIPLDKNRQAFEFLRFYLNDSYIDEVNRVQALLADMEVTQERGIPYGNYLPLKNGGFVGPTEAIRKHAQSYYKESGIEQAWRYELPFWNLGLLEFTFTQEGKRIARYALFRGEAKEVKDFGILTGMSDDVYRFATEKNGLVPENMAAYLKFFCWALEADEGKFILPERVCEIAWEEVPEKERWSEIHGKLLPPNPVWSQKGEESNETSNANGVVAYNQAFFDARFYINPETGLVTMTDDSPLLANLPIRQLRFQTGPSLHVTELPAVLPAAEEESPTYLNDFAGIRETPPLSPEDFLKILKAEGRVEGKRVAGEICIDDYAFAPCRESVYIINCWFEDNVRLATHMSQTGIRFEECMFAHTFSAKDCVQQKSLDFENCRFNDIADQEPAKQGIIVNFENYRSEGNLTFKNCYLFGKVYATNMKLSGDFSIKGCLISHSFFQKNDIYLEGMENVSVKVDKDYVVVNRRKLIYAVKDFIDTPILNIDNSQIKGNLEISTLGPTKNTHLNENISSIIVGNSSAKGIDIRGRATLLGSFIVGSLTLANSTFHQDVDFNEFISNYIQFRLIGDLDLSGCHLSGSLNLKYVDIEGNANLHNIWIDEHLNILGIHIVKDLDLMFSVIKGTLFGLYMKEEDNEENKGGETDKDDEKEIEIFFPDREPFQIDGDLLLSAAEIKHIRLRGGLIGKGIEINTGHFHSIRMSWGDGIKSKDCPPQPLRTKKIHINSIHVQGFFNLSGIQIGTVDMKDIKQRRKEMGFSSFTIRSSKIGSDLSLFSHEQFQENPDIRHPETIVGWGDLSLEANTVGGNLDLRQTWVVAGNIILEDTQIQLSLDMDGFCRVPTYSKDPIFEKVAPVRCNDFNMKRVSVNGNVLLSGLEVKNLKAKNNHIQGGGFFTAQCPVRKNNFRGKIYENLNFSASEINSINLTGENFVGVSERPTDVRIILERAKVNKIKVLSELPKINLSDAQISSWTIDYFPEDKGLSFKEWGVTLFIYLSLLLVILLRLTVPSIHRVWPDELIGLFTVFLILLSLMWWYIIRPKEDAVRYLEVLKKMDPPEKSPYLDIEMMLRNTSKGEDANEIYRAMRKKSRETYGGIQKCLDWLWFFFTGYGTRLWVLLFMWLGLFFVTAFYISYPGNHQPAPAFTSVGSCCLPDDHINPDSLPPLGTAETLILAGKHCIPGMDFPANGAHVVTEHTGPWLDLIYLTGFILLSLFGVSVTARLIRGKQ